MGSNLAQLSAEERQAIELDKQRWREANHMIDTKRPDEIKAWLLREQDEELREDMRRRLNVVRLNRREQMMNNERSASHSKRTGTR